MISVTLRDIDSGWRVRERSVRIEGVCGHSHKGTVYPVHHREVNLKRVHQSKPEEHQG